MTSESSMLPEDGGFIFGGELKNLRELSLNGLADEIRVEGVNGLALRRLFLRGCSKKDLGFLCGCRIDELYMEGSSAARVVVDLKYLENLPLQILHLGRLVRVRNTKHLVLKK